MKASCIWKWEGYVILGDALLIVLWGEGKQAGIHECYYHSHQVCHLLASHQVNMVFENRELRCSQYCSRSRSSSRSLFWKSGLGTNRIPEQQHVPDHGSRSRSQFPCLDPQQIWKLRPTFQHLVGLSREVPDLVSDLDPDSIRKMLFPNFQKNWERPKIQILYTASV